MGKDPNLQFRGIWIPASIVFLMRDKVITHSEMMLLSIVESLTEASGMPCWASTQYLAGLMGVKMRMAQLIIRKLIRLKLLKQGQDEGRRTLYTSWDNTMQGVARTAQSIARTAQSIARQSAIDCAGPSILRIEEDRKANSKTCTTSQRDNGGTSAVAVFNQAKEKPTKSTTFDESCADALYHLVVDVRKRCPTRWSIKKEANAFRLLRQELTEKAEERISRALDWYRQNCRRKDVPRIDDAITFRKRFNWLEDLVQKDLGACVEISEKAKGVTKRLHSLAWPKGTRDQVEVVVQMSLDAHDELTRGIKRLRTKSPAEGKDVDRFKRYLEHFAALVGQSDHYVEIWLRDVHKQVKDWKEWHGDLTREAFSIQAKRFQKTMKGAMDAWGGEFKYWNMLLEGLSCK